jgi:hypothetical protein
LGGNDGGGMDRVVPRFRDHRYQGSASGIRVVVAATP